MKKISLTIICAGVPRFPGCLDILRDWPEYTVVASARSLHAPGICNALGQSDVVILDQVLIEQEGAETVSSVRAGCPAGKVLLILEESGDEQVLDAIALGVDGVMEQIEIRAMLRKAISALYSGEPWFSRELAHSLRKQLQQGMPLGDGRTQPFSLSGREKLN
jgi:DNA-binding NarL/FixJ family response regulator